MTSSESQNARSDEGACPSCDEPLEPEHVLCLSCGFHLERRENIAHSYRDKQTSDNAREIEVDLKNPFAPPQPVGDAAKPPAEPDKIDMDLELADNLRFVNTEWRWIFVALGCSVFGCLPVPLFMFPWYAYKAYLWHRLYQKHERLRKPNAFAAYGNLAADFKDSRYPILGGMAIGFSMWCLLLIIYFATR